MWVEIIVHLTLIIICKKSHPHGCVSWNPAAVSLSSDIVWSHPHGCVSWNLDSTDAFGHAFVTPSRVCELKFAYFGTSPQEFVTPSRVCELKFPKLRNVSVNSQVTPSRVCELKFLPLLLLPIFFKSHPHGCVSWNSPNVSVILTCTPSHHHGCVCWNRSGTYPYHRTESHPHGCVSWNEISSIQTITPICHTLTGVWVEISYPQSSQGKASVTPSRVCTKNYDNFQIADLHPLRPKYKAKANHNHILINENSAETFASAPSIIP